MKIESWRPPRPNAKGKAQGQASRYDRGHPTKKEGTQKELSVFREPIFCPAVEEGIPRESNGDANADEVRAVTVGH
jgi:hypothetical protein